MEVGVEISQKIRSAIKAKLMELGSYVDNELPDYIMVMVANKKTKAQMAGDLSLFLGKNTEAFTTWLHGLLVKLQAINSDSDEVKGKNKKKKHEKSKKGESSAISKKKVKKAPQSKDHGESANVNKDSLREVGLNAAGNDDGDEKSQPEADVVDANNAGTEVGLQENVPGPDGDSSNSSDLTKDSANKFDDDTNAVDKTMDVEDVRQLLVTENTTEDALAEELETSEIADTDSVTEEQSASNDSTSVIQTKHVRHVQSESSPERQIDVTSRKRKGPVSIIGSIKISKSNEEEEDEYDPRNPSVGSVASVIKVSRPKSSIPQSLQANRTLLMKAMGEAERSIAVKRKVAIANPVTHGEATSDAPRYTPKRRLTKKEGTPPPYIPSKKSLPRTVGSRHENDRNILSRNDARHILDREEEKEMSAQAHRKELLKSLGIQHDNKEKESKSATVVHKREIKDERRKEKIHVQNFQITTHLVPIPDKSEKPHEDDEEISVTKVTKGSVSSRLGKVVAKGKSKQQAVTLKVKTRVKDGRIDLSRLGKALVKKQCEAAVLSVKSAQNTERLKAVPDSRVVCCDTEDDDDDKTSTKEVNQEKPDVKYEEPKAKAEAKRKESSEDDVEDLAEMISNDVDESLNDEFTLDLDDEDLSNVVDLEDVLKEEEDDKKGTRFIVTLDGVDDNGFEGKNPAINPQWPSVVETQRGLVTMDQYSTQPGYITQSFPLMPGDQYAHSVLRVAPPPKIQPVTISLKESDDEHEGKTEKSPSKTDTSPVALTAVQKAKLSERCRFWPACVAGSECGYHHPTTHCKTFPNCKFGDKCLFIHPNCRFDSKCARVDCPYTHTSKRAGLTGGSSVSIPPPMPSFNLKPYSDKQQTVCHFHPNCHNVNCYFLHPKPCRFGLSCLSPNCSFYHPTSSLPAKDKLKWQAVVPVSKPAFTKLPAEVPVQKVAPPPTKEASSSSSVSSTSQ